MRTVDFDAAVSKHGAIIPELLAAMEIEDCAQEGLDPGEFCAFPSEAEALDAQNKSCCGLVGEKDGFVRLDLARCQKLGVLAVPVIRAIDQAAERPRRVRSGRSVCPSAEGRGTGNIRQISTSSATASGRRRHFRSFMAQAGFRHATLNVTSLGALCFKTPRPSFAVGTHRYDGEPIAFRKVESRHNFERLHSTVRLTGCRDSIN